MSQQLLACVVDLHTACRLLLQMHERIVMFAISLLLAAVDFASIIFHHTNSGALLHQQMTMTWACWLEDLPKHTYTLKYYALFPVSLLIMPSFFPSMASLPVYTFSGALLMRTSPSRNSSPSRRIQTQLSDVIRRNITSPCPLKSPCFHPRPLRIAAACLCFSSSTTQNPPELSMTILPSLSIWRQLRWLLGESCFVRCQLR